MRLMKLGLLAIGGIVVLGSSAFAADLGQPVYKAPAPPPPPAYSWTGFYLGLNAGYGWANDDNNVSFINGDPVFYGPALLAGAIPTSLNPSAGGFIGGGQAGYNWQSGPAVFGLETDLQYANIAGSASTTTTVGFFPTITTSAQTKVDWFGTLRPRLGFTVAPSFLFYVTGGLAYGHVSSSASTLVIGPGISNCATNLYCSVGAAGQDRAGWTAGGGLEYALAAPWSVKVEYLYVDLGHETYNMPSTLAVGAGMQATTAFHENIIRGGVNYKF